jgi:hypothetical protein
MIKIQRGKEVAPAIFAYSIPSFGLSGRSREPLLVPAAQSKRSWATPAASRRASTAKAAINRT